MIFTRSRPYHKDDNAHVEQKNWMHVRQLFGYDRFENQELVKLMNDLYRLKWQGIAMVFSGDTRPNTFMLNQATNLDVLIHEVTLSPEVWAAKNTGRGPGDPLYSNAVVIAATVQNRSHTPAKALGYILSQLKLSNAAPRLAVATHCQFEDDTTNAVMTDIRSWYADPVALPW